MQEKCEHSMGNGFIFKKINENLNHNILSTSIQGQATVAYPWSIIPSLFSAEQNQT